jgi:hypothetical protein
MALDSLPDHLRIPALATKHRARDQAGASLSFGSAAIMLPVLLRFTTGAIMGFCNSSITAA